MGDDRFDRAIAAIDAANAADPERVVVRGEEQPKELAHARLMTEWVSRLRPEADEAELLAARAHHFRRWTRPRTDYPDGRGGYLRWRRDAARQHAEEVGALLAGCGYGDDVIERVQTIVRKQGLGTDPAVQANEDARCLVFLETQLASTTEQLGEDHMKEVVRKTAAKMSAEAIALVATLPLTPQERALVESALQADDVTPRRSKRGVG
jgi:hypothetical protein